MTPSEIARDEDFVAIADGLKDAIISEQAATIRAQAEALKIATEALEHIGSSGGYLADIEAAQALARIKEVG